MRVLRLKMSIFAPKKLCGGRTVNRSNLVSKKTDDNFSIHDFPRGQVNGFTDNLGFEKIKGGTD